jgi:(1->4)-alpha-D-glucan 1-alpha-D-glucosylmutase
LLGGLNSLSQLTLKATLPGVPDFYQGTEFWDLSLVDPDNRRPVDFDERAAVLASVKTPNWPALLKDWTSGHLKLAWTAHLLKLRTELADIFRGGEYHPLEVSGPHRDHVVAFARRKGSDAAIVAVVRHFASSSEGGRIWPRGEAFEGKLSLAGYEIEGMTDLPLSALFKHLPLAVVRAKVVSSAKPSRKRAAA